MNESNSKKAYIMNISSLLIVGTIGVFRRSIPIGSSLLAFYRGLIGSVSLLIFALLFKRGSLGIPDKKKLTAMIINGAVISTNWMLLFEAYNYTTIPKATLAYYMQPTIVMLLSPIVFHEKLTARKLLCAGVSLFGMVLVTGIGELSAADSDLRGILFALAAACFYAIAVMTNKKIGGADAYQKTIIQLLAAAVAMIPYMIIRGEFQGLWELDTKTLLLVLFVGIIHTGLTYILYFGSMSDLKAQTISVLGYIDPVTAMIVSYLVFREGLSFTSLIGAILIIGSAIVSEMER